MSAASRQFGTHAALIALLAVAVASCSLAAVDPRAAHIGGPYNVDGPLYVQGPLTVGGPCTVHGPIRAAGLAVGGPVYTLPGGERPGPAGQTFASPLYVGGPLVVNGPLIADGKLTIGGPLTSETGANVDTLLPSQTSRTVNQSTLVYQAQPAPQPQLDLPRQSTQGQGQLQPLSRPGEVTE